MQLLLVPLLVPLYVIVLAAQQLQHLKCRESIRVDRTDDSQKYYYLGNENICIGICQLYIIQAMQSIIAFL